MTSISVAGNGPAYPPAGIMMPGASNSILSWSTDPARLTATPPAATTLNTNGRQWFARLEWPVTATASNIGYILKTVGNTLTSAQCFFALYNSSGSLLCYTDDCATRWATGGDTVNVPTEVPITKDSVGGTISSLSITGAKGDFIWVSAHYNGTTGPTFYGIGSGFSAALHNLGTSNAQSRWALQTLGSTTAPASSITPSSMNQQTGPAPFYYIT
jgi:hypothetical protein